METRLLTTADDSAADQLAVEAGAIWQTAAWARLQEATNSPMVGLGLFNGANLCGLARGFVRRRRWGCFLQVLRGPIATSAADAQLLVDALMNQAQKLGCFAVSIEQPPELGCQPAGGRAAVRPVSPQETICLDVRKTDEQLLAEMKPKGRYNCRLAARHGVETGIETGPEAAKTFFKLLKKTTDRDGFSGHSPHFYAAFLQELGSAAACVVARREGQPLAASLLTFCGKEAVYYYGASDHAARQWMAPYAVQLAGLQLARTRGCHRYDLLGVAPTGQPQHPLAGVTAFKEKLGGQRLAHPASWDIPLTSGYLLERAVAFLKRK